MTKIKKSPGRPKKAENTTEVEELKKEVLRLKKQKEKDDRQIKELRALKKARKSILEDTQTGMIQYRDTEGVIKLMAMKAKDLSVHQWAKKIIHKELKIG